MFCGTLAVFSPRWLPLGACFGCYLHPLLKRYEYESTFFLHWEPYLLVFSLFCFVVFQQKRLSLLMASALFQGASIGPLIGLAFAIDPGYAFVDCVF